MAKKKSASILIVDDEPINVQLLAEGLSDDYHILFANSGESALAIAEAKLPDLILLDIDMPEMDGYQICRELKDNPRTKHIPITFITGHDSDEDELKGLQMGASDYFTKPFKMPLVKARVAILVDLKKKTDLLEVLVDLDGLTGIPNRRRFDISFDEEWRRAVRANSQLSLCMMDVDYFKQFNDNYGHAAGDQCLRRVADELEKVAKRAGELVARYGGEEFVLLLPNNSLQQAIEFAEKLRVRIESLGIQHSFSACAKSITLSFGIASVKPTRQGEHLALLKAADDQLYRAKESGRNCVKGIDLDT